MNTLNIKEIIENLFFEHEQLEDEINIVHININNPYDLVSLINKIKELDSEIDTSSIQQYLEELKKIEVKVTKEEIKQVYIKLKDRLENPRGYFDKMGRFYIEDYELIDVRAPSAKYPYSQMNAARTAKFVKALAEKYKCQTLEELEKVAFSNH